MIIGISLAEQIAQLEDAAPVGKRYGTRPFIIHSDFAICRF
jgi:hypothetical protein